MVALRIIILTIAVIFSLLFIRLLNVLPRFRPNPQPRRRGTPTQLLIVLGSGGHTAEMLLLLRDLDTVAYNFRRYVVSSGDSFSSEKALEFEKQLECRAEQIGKPYGDFDITTVTRARKIHQSLSTTPFSALRCAWDCLNILRTGPILRSSTKGHETLYPDIIMTNGPATATIMIFASLAVRYLGFEGSKYKMRCIYVESWARVSTPSLSGKILSACGVCDRLLVQWPRLATRGLEFRGQLIA